MLPMIFTIMFTLMFKMFKMLLTMLTMLTGQSWRRLSSSPGRSWIPPGPGSPRRTDGNLGKDGISILSYLHQWHLLKVELVFCISYQIYTIGINGISLLHIFIYWLFRQMLIWKDEIRNQSQNMKSSHIEPQLWKIFFHVPSSSNILFHLVHSISLIEKICEPLLSIYQVTSHQHTPLSDQHVMVFTLQNMLPKETNRVDTISSMLPYE